MGKVGSDQSKTSWVILFITLKTHQNA